MKSMVSELPFKEKKKIWQVGVEWVTGKKRGTNGNRSALINIQTESHSYVSVVGGVITCSTG